MADDKPVTRRQSARVASQSSEAKSGDAKTATNTSTKRPQEQSESTAKERINAKKQKQVSDAKDTSLTSPAPTGSASKSKSSILAVGDALPTLTLSDEEGHNVAIADLKNAVIFTYPKANTGGCTKQACLYRDEYGEWTKLGFQVYGLSNDGTTSLKNWKAKQNFPYPLLSDPQRALVGALTGSKSSTTRSHFVVGKDGRVALSSVGVKPAESSPAALKFAKGL